jgi:DNA (cytosine-5)-methyltransferase 1
MEADSVNRPRLLDLFCCEGGAARGYDQAGFDVFGVDCEPQPDYPYPMHQGDALAFVEEHGHEFDVIHASPPCQGYSTMTADHSKHPRMIPQTRAALVASGRPYIIENVAGARAHMEHPILVCGSSFGMAVRRHRFFESNVPLMSMPCTHKRQGRPIGVYGEHPQDQTDYRRPDGTLRDDKAKTVEHAREVMGMPWASWHGCTQAIPPAYTHFIGEQLMSAVLAGVS